MIIFTSQIPVISANPKANFYLMQQDIEKAISQKSDLIVFPEMALPGYFNGDIWEQTSFLKECEYYHEQIASLSDQIHIIFGSVGVDWQNKNEDGRVRKYNALFHAHQGKFTKNTKTGFFFWPKTLMPNYRYFDDSRYFYDLRKLAYEKNCLAEDLYEPLCISIGNKNLTIGLSICEDGWSSDYSISPMERFAARFQHDFFINASCSPFSKGKIEARKRVFSELSKKINCPIYYVNCTGVQNIGKTICTFDGSSRLYDKGNVTTLGGFFSSDFNSSQGAASETEELRIALEYAIKQCCQQWNIKRVVIGASGGIDSALSAVLFCQALGKENVFLVNMPSQFNFELTQNAAQKLAKNLDCAYASISIQKSYEYTQQQLKDFKFENSDVTLNISGLVLENIQARDRGSRILAAISAALGAVFPCNANKSEATVGYSTLYGDHAGFLCPIADLWKHEVYALAHHYNDFVFGKKVIPDDTLNVVPSAELSSSQNVLEGKGDPIIYDYHDYLFRSWMEHWDRKTPEDCLKAYMEERLDDMIGCKPGLSKKLFPTTAEFISDLERWWRCFCEAGSFKRIQSPPVISVSGRSFGSDFRDVLSKALYTQGYEQLKAEHLPHTPSPNPLA